MAIASGEANGHIFREITPAEPGSVADYEDFVTPRYLAITGAEMTAVHVIFGDSTVLSEEGQPEIAILTQPVSGRTLREDLERLAACGGKVTANIPVYQC